MPVNLAKLRNIAAKLKNPRRVSAYFGTDLAYRLKTAKVPVLPPWIDIEPNNTCNLRCQHCQVPHWSKPPAYLDEPSFARILDQLPGLIAVKLQGMGEPLLNRNLVAMLREGERRGISMQFISNGTIMSQEQAEQLLQLKNTHICFSIDGATAATHEKIRLGSRLEQIVANIKKLVTGRGHFRQPAISITAVLNACNLREIPGIVTLAREMGVDGVNIQTALTNWGKQEIKRHNDAIRVAAHSEQAAAVLREAQGIACASHVPLKIQDDDYYSRARKCPWPWKRAFIAANGDVVPCCILADASTINMGNVFERDFSEIWNSRQYSDLRVRIRNHDLPDFCRNCYRD